MNCVNVPFTKYVFVKYGKYALKHAIMDTKRFQVADETLLAQRNGQKNECAVANVIGAVPDQFIVELYDFSVFDTAAYLQYRSAQLFHAFFEG